MDTTIRTNQTLPARIAQGAALAWYYLRQPQLTAALVSALILAAGAGWLLPQQPAGLSNADAWIAALPAPIRLWGQPLFWLGFAKIFQSGWFWLPAALLLLNSLVALADYLPGARARSGHTSPSIEWQHPLAGRLEQVARLSRSPQVWLAALKNRLAAQGFAVYQPAEDEGRLIGAARRRWAWWGPVGLYAGLALLVSGFIVSSSFGQAQTLTLFPNQPQNSRLLPGRFELTPVSQSDVTQETLLFWPDQAGVPARVYSIRLFNPAWFGGMVWLPVGRDPLFTVEVRNAANARLRLIPVQEDLPPADRLHLPLPAGDAPLYFLIPAVNLAVQVRPNPADPLHSYNIQVRRGANEPVTPENGLAQAGQPFALDDLTVTISPSQTLNLVTYADPALAVYLLAAALLLGGLAATLLWPPVQVWLAPEVKGLGGQLYGVLEKIGPLEQSGQFLAQLLSLDPEESPAPESTGPGD